MSARPLNSRTRIAVIDVETTGFPPDASVVEIAWTPLDLCVGEWVIGNTTSHLVRPKHPITLEAMAVHHITDAMVADAPLMGELPALPATDADCLAAHNSEFDQQFYAVKTRPWICTLKAARRIWPDAPKHSNQVLRYWCEQQKALGLDEARTLPAHRAGPDTYVTAALLKRMLETESIETLIQWSTEPMHLPVVPFGKHKGEKWDAVPTGYLSWMASDRGPDDKNVKAAATAQLTKRGE